jgi:hypothetical protein
MKLFALFFALVGSVSSAANCTSNLTDIFSSQNDNGTVISTEKPQVWTLCPNTEYKTGFLTSNDIVGGMTPLFLRSNMTIQCGEDGKNSNNCTVTTGTVGFLVVPGFFFQDEYVIENGVLSGITFVNLREEHFVIYEMGGNIDVIDCRFYVSTFFGIMADVLIRLLTFSVFRVGKCIKL